MSENGFQCLELVEGGRANTCQGQHTAWGGVRAGERPPGERLCSCPREVSARDGKAGPPLAAGRAESGRCGAYRKQARSRRGAIRVQVREKRGAGSYLLQGEGGAVTALLPSQESIIKVAGGVTSEGGRACGRRDALGAA